MSEAPSRLILHGRLRKRFGPELRLAGSTPARVLQIAMTLLPELRAVLSEGEYRVVRGALKRGVHLTEHSLHLRLPPSGVFHLLPAAKGGKGGGGKVILGIVLIAAAFIMPYAAPGLFAGAGAIFTAGSVLGVSVFSSLGLMGAALVLGGISQMMSPQATKPAGASAQLDQHSFLIGGTLNVAQSGALIPVQYGRILTGSLVASVGYEAVDAALETIEQAVAAGTVPPGSVVGSSGKITSSTLRSKAIVRIVDIIGEGPIVGLVGGSATSIFFNGTPLQASDGQFNFKGVTWEQRFGTPDQPPVAGYPASETTVAVSARVVLATPVVRTIVDPGATAVRITIQIPQLYERNARSGDFSRTELMVIILMRPSRQADIGGWQGDWNQVSNDVISGALFSPYEKSYRFTLPGIDNGANHWDIKVQRGTLDSLSELRKNDLVWSNYTIITDHLIGYADCAYVALTFDAELFGSSVPARTYLIDGRQVQVPQNYNAVGRTYATSGAGTTGGTWDSVSTIAGWTSNPAWCLLDMLSNSRYGAGIAKTYVEVTRAELYVIAQYCDQLVPDGFGGSEPRYQVHANITTQADAFAVIQTMVSAFRGMSYWGSGQVAIVADMPRNPVKLINQTNVSDTGFAYEGTSLKTRHNRVRVTYREPSRQFNEMVEIIELEEDVARRGVVPTDIVAWGCTSRGLAHRLGKWLLFSESEQTETLTYQTGPMTLDLRPGDIFQQQDPAYVGLRWSGRLLAASTDVALHLDDILDTSGGTTFDLTVVLATGAIAERSVPVGSIGYSVDGTHSVINLAVSLGTIPPPAAEWILFDQTMSPRLWQVAQVHEQESARFQVTAINHDPGKFSWVELNIRLRPTIFSHLPELLLSALLPPSNVTARDYMVGVGTTQVVRSTVGWTAPNEPRLGGFEVLAETVDDGSFSQIYDAGRAVSFDIDGLPAARFRFSARCYGNRVPAVRSIWVAAEELVTVNGSVDPPGAPLGLTAIGGTRRVAIYWNAMDRRDIHHYDVYRSPDINGGWGDFSKLVEVSGTSWTDNDHDRMQPRSIWWYTVRAITLTAVEGVLCAPVHAQTNWLIADDLQDGIINTAKFAAGIVVPGLVVGVPTGAPGSGQSEWTFSETTGQLYHWNGIAWVSLAQQIEEAGISVEAGAIIGQLTNEQISSLAAAKITGLITATQIGPNSISTGSLQAGSVTTAKLTASAITAETLSIGAASNVIWNSCLELAATGWNFGSVSASGAVKGSPYDPTWRLFGAGTGYMRNNGPLPDNASVIMVAAWDPSYGIDDALLGVPFPGGVPVEVQARLGCHRCAAYCVAVFYGGAGNVLGSVTGSRVGGNYVGGTFIDAYGLSWGTGISPPGTISARFMVFAFRDGGSDIASNGADPTSYCFFTRTAIGVTVPHATQPQAWQAGGVTSLTGTMLRTQSVNADRILARSITGDKVVAGQLIAGQIAAAAIGAVEIAAQQIRATHLAADFALFSSAQIGVATIAHANIQDLVVDTNNIQYASVTQTSTSSMGAPQYHGDFLRHTLASCGVRVLTNEKVIIIAKVRCDGWAATLPSPNGGGT